MVGISSGLRSPELNRAVDGSEKSLHMHGKAADFTIGNPENLFQAYEFIRDELPHAHIELIYYADKNIVHVALPHPGRGQLQEIRK
jgi:hypothetical protein